MRDRLAEGAGIVARIERRRIGRRTLYELGNAGRGRRRTKAVDMRLGDERLQGKGKRKDEREDAQALFATRSSHHFRSCRGNPHRPLIGHYRDQVYSAFPKLRYPER